MCPNPDPPPAVPASAISDAAPDAGLVVLIGCDPARPAELPWPALAALAAADAVLHDGAVDAGILALIPNRCFVELVPVEAAGSTARVEKLAGEGWRVVRLSIDDPAVRPMRLAEADRLAASGIAICTIAGLSDHRLPDHRLPEHRPATLDPAALWAVPRQLSTGMNGLAG
jgi:uroporphyrin-III C-methyltransferase/precorrin-2 dehydrogenase/sirohydrochlorin ferrochelatase